MREGRLWAPKAVRGWSPIPRSWMNALDLGRTDNPSARDSCGKGCYWPKAAGQSSDVLPDAKARTS